MEAIPLIPVESRRQLEVYQAYVIASLALGVGGGFVLGVLIPLGRALGWGLEGQRPDLISVHGLVQVIGFAGLFVMGMALRLMPRFSGVHLKHDELVFPALGLIVAGLLVRTLVALPLPDDLQGPLVAGAHAAILAGTACFAAIVLRTLSQPGSRADATGYMFVVGAICLVAGASVATLVAIDEAWDNARVLSFVPSAAVLHLFLVGFLMAFIAGVGTRAIPTMVGVARPMRSVKMAAVVLALSVAATSGGLLTYEYIESSEGVLRVVSAGYCGAGVVFLAIAWLSGIFRATANRLRPASQPHLWLVRSSMAWLAFAGVLSLYFGGRAFIDSTIPTQFQIDAIRHALGIGAITALIMGMALMIVPEFAGERLATRQQTFSLALAVLVNAAAVLRVAPALTGLDWSADLRAWSMAAGGLTAQAAVVIFAFSFLRLFLGQRDTLTQRG